VRDVSGRISRLEELAGRVVVRPRLPEGAHAESEANGLGGEVFGRRPGNDSGWARREGVGEDGSPGLGRIPVPPLVGVEVPTDLDIVSRR
jgi:hypothetical protein